MSSRRGVSLTEVLIAAFLGVMLMGLVILLMSRTGTTFTKTNDMINAQVLLESIVERLRSDARSMISIVEKTETGIRFRTRRGGKESLISYRHDPVVRSIVREEVSAAGAPVSTKDFQSQGKVSLLHFQFGKMERPGVQEAVDHIDLVLHISINERPDAPATNLSIICQVFSTCIQLPNPFRRQD